MHSYWIINEQITFHVNVFLSYVNVSYYARWCGSGSLALDQIRILALSIDELWIQSLTINYLRIRTFFRFPRIDHKQTKVLKYGSLAMIKCKVQPIIFLRAGFLTLLIYGSLSGPLALIKSGSDPIKLMTFWSLAWMICGSRSLAS